MKKNILIVLSIVTVLCCIQPIVRLDKFVFIDYNEGWNAYFADMAISGKQIYQPKEDLIQNNYPPIAFYLVGIMGRILGDTIIGGRLLSIIGILISSAIAAFITYHFTKSRFYGALGAMLIIGYMGLYHTDYFGMNDPHWLGQGLMMTGLLIFMLRNNTRSGIIFSIVVMLIAGFVKHNFLAIPLACTLWLWFNKRDKFLRWITTSIILLAFSFALLLIIYGGQFFSNIFFAPRSYHIGAIARAGQWLQPALLYFVISLIICIWDKSAEMKLLKLSLILSLFFGLLVIGGGGVYVNVLYESIIFGIIISVIGLNSAINYLKNNRKMVFVGVFILSLPIISILPFKLYLTKQWLKDLPKKEQEIKNDINYISKIEGKVICENLALQYWSGKPFVFDFFSVGQMLKTKKLDNEFIEKLIAEKNFTVIQLDDCKGKSAHLPDEIVEKMKEYYTSSKVTTSGLLLMAK